MTYSYVEVQYNKDIMDGFANLRNRGDLSMKTISITLWLVALIFSACGPRYGAGQERDSLALWPTHPDLEALIDRADAIVVVEVVRNAAVQTVHSDSARALPIDFTDSVARIERSLKGSLAGEVLISQVGHPGRADFPDFPVLRPGTRVLLFIVDISDEPLQAGKGTVFGILGPEGMYQVVGDRLVSSAHATPVTEAVVTANLAQIDAKIASRR